jgi:hypothetical protein
MLMLCFLPFTATINVCMSSAEGGPITGAEIFGLQPLALANTSSATTSGTIVPTLTVAPEYVAVGIVKPRMLREREVNKNVQLASGTVRVIASSVIKRKIVVREPHGNVWGRVEV